MCLYDFWIVKESRLEGTHSPRNRACGRKDDILSELRIFAI